MNRRVGAGDSGAIFCPSTYCVRCVVGHELSIFFPFGVFAFRTF